ncbi:lipopolysaccharide biosynthesis protein [Ruminiclostridium cellobioparum]|uniref:lipopolysaccharide biosynthesis protein n=1 Tax=Ruminiclostridium cellobioparum TaxID=29355 RepID=UPI0004826975|nr:lipopolysaccharide biosynthesis protein [Ruminiclostridium cellobioparum]
MKGNNLTNKVVNATKWASITEISAKIVSPISNMILARIIAPEAFGVVATVTMIMSFADMFTDAGFQKYLVQHDFRDEEEKFDNANVAFWTNIVISILLLLGIIIFRQQIAELVGNPGLGNVVAIACVQLVFTSFSSIQMALYRRNFNYKELFLVRMVTVSIPFVVTVPLALFGLGFWSLIVGGIFMQFANSVILTVNSKWKPKLFYDIKILKEMLSFSVWSLIEAVSIWLTVWVDVFIIGSSFNQYYLGIYKTSTGMVNVLMGIVTSSTVPVLFAALSRLKNDDNQFKIMLYKTQRFVSILVFPLGVGSYIYSNLATKILLGSQWNEASGVIGVYALTNSIIIVFGYYCSEVYRAKGRPRLSLFAQVLHLVFLIPTCIISAKYGFWIFVYARSWAIIEFVLVHFILIKISMGFPVSKMIKNVFPTAFSATLMGFLGYFLQLINKQTVWSVISIIICALFYFGILLLFPNMRVEIYGMIKRLKLKRLN